jgi:hypothetical protein
MSKGPEANFWNLIRANLPPKTFATRIENRHGGGVPDVHMIWDGLPIWFELKITTKSNRLNLSPHQVAWHMAYYARGGLSFFLAKDPSSRQIVLFSGSKGPELIAKPYQEVQGSWFDGPAPLFEALRPEIEEHFRRVLRPAPCD